MSSKLTFTTATEMYRVPADSVIYVDAEGNYSKVYILNNPHNLNNTSGPTPLLLTMQLGQIEVLISKQLEGDTTTEAYFIRIGKSIIVNLNYIYYINPQQKKLTLSDCRTFKIELEASKEALKTLKEHLEKQIK